MIIRSGERDAPVLLIQSTYRSHTLADGRRTIVDVLVPGDIAGFDHALASGALGEFTAARHLSYQALSVSAARDLMADGVAALRMFALLAEARWLVERLATMIGRLDATPPDLAQAAGLGPAMWHHFLPPANPCVISTRLDSKAYPIWTDQVRPRRIPNSSVST